MIYSILLLVFALIDQFRGRVEVWRTTVRDWEFLAAKDTGRDDSETGSQSEMTAWANSSEQEITRQPQLPLSVLQETHLPAYSDIAYDETL